MVASAGRRTPCRTDAAEAEGMNDESNRKQTIVEEVELAGRELLQFLQDLVEKGNVRRVIIRTRSGKKMLEIPMTAGAVVGGAALILAPWMTILAGLAALLAEVRVEVEREVEEAEVVEQEEAGPTEA